jgi:dCMP deaminase
MGEIRSRVLRKTRPRPYVDGRLVERSLLASGRLSVRTDWDNRFLRLAKHVSEWSRDPSTKVGAVISRQDHTIASLGFNGFPMGVSDDPLLYQDREVKYSRVVHAEMNAILFLRERGVGFTLYTWPFLPCVRCAACVIQAGIARVVAPPCTEERWAESIQMAVEMFGEAGVEVSYGLVDSVG